MAETRNADMSAITVSAKTLKGVVYDGSKMLDDIRRQETVIG